MIEPKGFATIPIVVARELIAQDGRTRVPEPMVMDEPDSVSQFEGAGRDGGPLVPIYEMAARASSRIAPHGSHVVDLGCGPAHHLSYFAQRRPDVRITGLDLSPNMLKLGRRTIEQEGVADRVTLVQGDMTDFADDFADQPLDLVTSVFALHHLPSIEHLAECFTEIAELREKTGCGVMLFDICRLRHAGSWRSFISAAAGGLLATPQLEHDTVVSEAAAWSFDEMRQTLNDCGLEDLNNRRSFPFTGFQLHSAPPLSDGWQDGDAEWRELPMSLGLRTDVVPLKLLFGQV